MRVGPDRRLVGAAAAWTAAAVVVVAWPPLGAPLAGALAVLAALVAWDAWLLRRAPAVGVRRELPARAFVGRAAEVGLVLQNDGARPAPLELIDEVPADLAAEEPHFPALVVPAHGTLTVRYAILPAARGDRPCGPAIVLRRSPLGLLRRRERGGSGDPLRVYPDTTRFLRPEALRPRRVFAAIGVRPARTRGEGMEFESLRDYVAGDEPRRIDWAASARRGRLVTRLYQHERHHNVLIALDASRLMAGLVGGRSKLDHAVDGALALAYAGLASGDRVGMLVFDREVRGLVTPRAHRRHLGLFVDLLRAVEPAAVEPDYRALAREIVARQRRRALLIVLTDFVEVDPGALVGPLVQLARRHRVLLVALRDAAYDALAPPAPGGREEPLDLYRRVVLDELLRGREITLARLRRHGLQTLDLSPDALTASVLNRYLALRHAPAA